MTACNLWHIFTIGIFNIVLGKIIYKKTQNHDSQKKQKNIITVYINRDGFSKPQTTLCLAISRSVPNYQGKPELPTMH